MGGQQARRHRRLNGSDPRRAERPGIFARPGRRSGYAPTGTSLAAVLDQGKSVAAAERALEPGHASLQPWAGGAVSVPQAAAAKSRLTTTCVGRP